MSLEQDNKVNDYSEKSIRILKGLQPVKQRPGMYTLTDCPLHIIQQVIDNATDEVLANFAKRIMKMEKKRIPEDIDYEDVGSLRIEAKQKLSKIRPSSIGQASRISGVSPADISVLLIYLEQMHHRR